MKIELLLTVALIGSFLAVSPALAAAPSVTTNTANITSDHNVTLYCSYNSNGLYTTIWFELGTNSSLSGARTVYANTDCTAGVINLLSGTTYYYQAVARNSDGTTFGSTNSFTMPGSSGGSYTNTGGNNGSGYNSGYNNCYNNCYNNGYVPNGNTSYGGYNINSGPAVPQALTNGPASVAPTTAVLNGSVNPENSPETKFWFMFDTSQILDASSQKTSVQPTGGGNANQLVTANISGLTPGTTYYYQVVAQNNSGTAFGGSRTLTTPTEAQYNANQANGQVLGATTSVNGTSGSTSTGKTTSKTTSHKTSIAPIEKNAQNPRPSFISLEYSLEGQGALVLSADNIKPNPGDNFNYTVVYKNDTNSTFNNAGLKVIIPSDTSFLNASTEPIIVSGDIVQFDLGNVAPHQNGEVIVTVKIKETAAAGENLIFTSVMTYKDSFGIQLATTSYLTLKIGASGKTEKTASIFGAFSGSAGLLLFAFGLIILLGIVIYVFLRYKKMKKEESKDFDMGMIPPTVEPLPAPMGRPDVFQPISK